LSVVRDLISYGMMWSSHGGSVKRIPIEMRRRMLTAVERGEPVNAVAWRFVVTPRGLRKLIRTVCEWGDLSPAKPGPKGPTMLTPADDAKLLELINRDPGVTINAIREHGVPSPEETGRHLEIWFDRPRAATARRGPHADELRHREGVRRTRSLRRP